MAKGVQQTKAQTKSPNGNHVVVEQNAAFDDSLLPSADELIKIKDIDPTLIEWIKQRAEKEQDARIRFNDNRIDITQREAKRNHVINLTSIYMACFIIVLGMAFSFYLIHNNQDTTGTIFAGATIVAGAVAFIPRRQQKSK